MHTGLLILSVYYINILEEVYEIRGHQGGVKPLQEYVEPL